MKKNSLLKIASITCKLINAAIIVTIIMITGFFIHFQIDKSAYKNWDFVDQKSSTSLASFESKVDYPPNSKTTNSHEPNLLNFSTTSLYFNYFKFTLTASFIFMSLRLFEKVAASVRNLKTFEKVNTYAFKRIGVYCFIIGLISCFDYFDFETQFWLTRISINVHFFIFSLLAFVLAEIFKEGNLLKQENDLTV